MTPGGKLQKGDRLRHRASGLVCIVTARLGNDAGYGVKIKREDGRRIGGALEANLLTAQYQIAKGNWELIR